MEQCHVISCHACVQARLRELRGEDLVAEGQSGIVAWVVVVVGNPKSIKLRFCGPDSKSQTSQPTQGLG